jgi:hypothetical protein
MDSGADSIITIDEMLTMIAQRLLQLKIMSIYDDIDLNRSKSQLK